MPPASPDPDQPALGAAVKAIREEKNVTQVGLSRATGFRQSWVSDVENGRRSPSFASVVRLAANPGLCRAFLQADEGIRTLDLRHGKATL